MAVGKRVLVFESGNSMSYEALVYGVDEDEPTFLANANAVGEGKLKSETFRINYVLDHTGITNMIGDQSKEFPGSNNIILDLSHLKNGLYLVSTIESPTYAI